MEQDVLDPPLKWCGGKRYLIPTLQELWAPHSHRRLVDPFLGGMSIPLGLRPQRALLSDLNVSLMNFYRHLKNGLTTTIQLENNEELYYRHRDTFNRNLAYGDPWCQENAQLFYYLNRTGFNGLCRFNSSGEFNVPFGKYKTINYVNDFYPYNSVMKGWDLWYGDFKKVPVLPDDFIYCDPPYDVDFTKFTADDFKWEDQERLADWAAYHPGPIVLSNQATDRIEALYRGRGFTIRYIQAPRRVSSDGDRTPAREVLAFRNI